MNNIYLNLKNTCKNIERHFGSNDLNVTAIPNTEMQNGSVVGMSIKLEIETELTEDQVIDAEEIVQDIYETLTD